MYTSLICPKLYGGMIVSDVCGWNFLLEIDSLKKFLKTRFGIWKMNSKKKKYFNITYEHHPAWKTFFCLWRCFCVLWTCPKDQQKNCVFITFCWYPPTPFCLTMFLHFDVKGRKVTSNVIAQEKLIGNHWWMLLLSEERNHFLCARRHEKNS